MKCPNLPVKDLGIYPTCDVITFDWERQHLCLSFGAGRYLSNNTLTRPIGWSLKCAPKRFEILVKNSEENFPFPPFGLFMASISSLVNAFSKIHELKRSLLEGQQLQQKIGRREKGKAKKKKKDKKQKALSGGMAYLQTLTFAHDLCQMQF